MCFFIYIYIYDSLRRKTQAFSYLQSADIPQEGAKYCNLLLLIQIFAALFFKYLPKNYIFFG